MLEVIASLAESDHPVCLSAAQLAPWPARLFSTWPQHESSPPTAPHTGVTEGAEPRRCDIHPPPRMKRESTEPAPQGEMTAEWASPPNLMGGEGDRDSPISIPSNRSN